MTLSSTRPNTLRQIERMQFDALFASTLVRRGSLVSSLVCAKPNLKFNRPVQAAGQRSVRPHRRHLPSRSL
jgi:hypothetical protein